MNDMASVPPPAYSTNPRIAKPSGGQYGYSPLPAAADPRYTRSPYPMSPYAPAPPVLQQQSNNVRSWLFLPLIIPH